MPHPLHTVTFVREKAAIWKGAIPGSQSSLSSPIIRHSPPGVQTSGHETKVLHPFGGQALSVEIGQRSVDRVDESDMNTYSDSMKGLD